jgi:hypothetical protein
LEAAIVLVLVLAVVVALITERTPSRAAPPAPSEPATTGTAQTLQPPTAVPTQATTPTADSTQQIKRATRLSTAWGVDISWPQCGAAGMPALKPGFAVIGINDGTPFTQNPCLDRELAYARTQTGVATYLNIEAPRGGDATAYGRKIALDGLARMQRAGISVPVVWLDVEILNHWSSSGAANVAVINGALAALQSHGVTGGIYSSIAMWQQITGGAKLSVPVWLATSVTDYHQLPSWCATGLGGRGAEMAQYIATDGRQLVDVDVLCPKAIPQVVGEFAPGRK